jgi:hypothetical protein
MAQPDFFPLSQFDAIQQVHHLDLLQPSSESAFSDLEAELFGGPVVVVAPVYPTLAAFAPTSSLSSLPTELEITPAVTFPHKDTLQLEPPSWVFEEQATQSQAFTNVLQPKRLKAIAPAEANVTHSGMVIHKPRWYF